MDGAARLGTVALGTVAFATPPARPETSEPAPSTQHRSQHRAPAGWSARSPTGK
ncbi:Hypothetical predicted protein [Lynx pardinus]|uniref:Uncharacterized protein n=1 Tax=Lynx pardinus TaxID=191816 RepID=A0A485MN75_LYNPA|nr:Hypothetical predicted protein [Lynx pardinus]